MKIKRIISLITSSVIGVLAVSPFSSNAILGTNLDDPYYYEYISQLIPIDEKYSPLFADLPDLGRGTEKEYYIAPNNWFIITSLEPDYFTFNITKVGSNVITGVTNTKEFKDTKEKVIYRIQQDLGVYARFVGNTCWIEGIENISAKAISSYLKQNNSFSDLEFSNLHYNTGNVAVKQYETLPNRALVYGVNPEDDIEAIVKYVDENYDNIEISCSEKYSVKYFVTDPDEEYIDILIKLKNDDWTKDFLDIAWGIYNEFGYRLQLCQLESVGTKFTNTSEIDVENYLDGDANCDGKLTIADSTAILQSLGNTDKYGLSYQGEFNADIYNAGDGVTAMDALEVQNVIASNK